MFIRMIVRGALDSSSGREQGVFQAAAELRDSGELLAEDQKLLRQILRWFNDNLPGRESFPKRLHPHAIFWFKSDNHELTRKAWELVNELRRHDLNVQMIKTARPGKIVFEDKWQVAAVPFKDLRKSYGE